MHGHYSTLKAKSQGYSSETVEYSSVKIEISPASYHYSHLTPLRKVLDAIDSFSDEIEMLLILYYTTSSHLFSNFPVPFSGLDGYKSLFFSVKRHKKDEEQHFPKRKCYSSSI
jgi:hypothetical protein